MKRRVVTASILAPLTISSILFFNIPLLTLVLAATVLLAFWEWTQFLGVSSRAAAMIPFTCVFIAGYYLFPIKSHSHLLSHETLHFLGISVACWCAACMLVITYPRIGSFLAHLQVFAYFSSFITLLPFFWSVVILRTELVNSDPYHGGKLVLFVCSIVWTADSAAYFFGRMFGRYQVAPSISPNKTIEGLIGGLVSAAIMGYLIARWFNVYFISDGLMLTTVLLTTVFSIFGDLFESLFKRVSGIKDSGDIIPGHGGLLDRIDSLTAAFPIFTFLYFLY